MNPETWESTPGQCLVCGGRGGYWTGDTRQTCPSCKGDGWDPARNEPWFIEHVAPHQMQYGETE